MTDDKLTARIDEAVAKGYAGGDDGLREWPGTIEAGPWPTPPRRDITALIGSTKQESAAAFEDLGPGPDGRPRIRGLDGLVANPSAGYQVATGMRALLDERPAWAPTYREPLTPAEERGVDEAWQEFQQARAAARTNAWFDTYVRPLLDRLVDEERAELTEEEMAESARVAAERLEQYRPVETISTVIPIDLRTAADMGLPLTPAQADKLEQEEAELRAWARSPRGRVRLARIRLGEIAWAARHRLAHRICRHDHDAGGWD